MECEFSDDDPSPDQVGDILYQSFSDLMDSTLSLMLSSMTIPTKSYSTDDVYDAIMKVYKHNDLPFNHLVKYMEINFGDDKLEFANGVIIDASQLDDELGRTYTARRIAQKVDLFTDIENKVVNLKNKIIHKVCIRFGCVRRVIPVEHGGTIGYIRAALLRKMKVVELGLFTHLGIVLTDNYVIDGSKLCIDCSIRIRGGARRNTLPRFNLANALGTVPTYQRHAGRAAQAPLMAMAVQPRTYYTADGYTIYSHLDRPADAIAGNTVLLVHFALRNYGYDAGHDTFINIHLSGAQTNEIVRLYGMHGSLGALSYINEIVRYRPSINGSDLSSFAAESIDGVQFEAMMRGVHAPHVDVVHSDLHYGSDAFAAMKRANIKRALRGHGIDPFFKSNLLNPEQIQTHTDNCVLDWLIQSQCCTRSNGGSIVRSGVRNETIAQLNSTIQSIRRKMPPQNHTGGEELYDGVTPEEVLAWARKHKPTVNITMIGVDQFASGILVQYECKENKRSISCIVYDGHCYPMSNETLLPMLSQRDGIFDVLPLQFSSEHANDCNNISLWDEFEPQGTDELIYIRTNRTPNDVAMKLVEEGIVVSTVQFNGYLYSSKYMVKFCDWELEDLCKEFSTRDHNLELHSLEPFTVGGVVRRIIYGYIGPVPTVSSATIIGSLMNNFESTAMVYNICPIDMDEEEKKQADEKEDNGGKECDALVQLDIRKAYSHALMMCNKIPVINELDAIVPYKEFILTKEYADADPKFKLDNYWVIMKEIANDYLVKMPVQIMPGFCITLIQKRITIDAEGFDITDYIDSVIVSRSVLLFNSTGIDDHHSIIRNTSNFVDPQEIVDIARIYKGLNNRLVGYYGMKEHKEEKAYIVESLVDILPYMKTWEEEGNHVHIDNFCDASDKTLFQISVSKKSMKTKTRNYIRCAVISYVNVMMICELFKWEEFINKGVDIIAVKTDAIILRGKPSFIEKHVDVHLWKQTTVIRPYLPLSDTFPIRLYEPVPAPVVHHSSEWQNNDDENILLLGKAGSGKTYSVLSYIHEIEEKNDRMIYVCAFMNETVRTVRVAYEKRFKSTGGIQMGTIHSLWAIHFEQVLTFKGLSSSEYTLERMQAYARRRLHHPGDTNYAKVMNDEELALIQRVELEHGPKADIIRYFNILIKAHKLITLPKPLFVLDELSVVPDVLLRKFASYWNVFDMQYIWLGDLEQCLPVQPGIGIPCNVLACEEFKAMFQHRYEMVFNPELNRYTMEMYQYLESFIQTTKLLPYDFKQPDPDHVLSLAFSNARCTQVSQTYIQRNYNGVLELGKAKPIVCKPTGGSQSVLKADNYYSCGMYVFFGACCDETDEHNFNPVICPNANGVEYVTWKTLKLCLPPYAITWNGWNSMSTTDQEAMINKTCTAFKLGIDSEIANNASKKKKKKDTESRLFHMVSGKDFRLGYCVTVHSVQGLSLEGAYSIYGSRNMNKNVLYTALSRASCLENIHLDIGENPLVDWDIPHPTPVYVRDTVECAPELETKENSWKSPYSCIITTAAHACRRARILKLKHLPYPITFVKPTVSKPNSGFIIRWVDGETKKNKTKSTMKCNPSAIDYVDQIERSFEEARLERCRMIGMLGAGEAELIPMNKKLIICKDPTNASNMKMNTTFGWVVTTDIRNKEVPLCNNAQRSHDRAWMIYADNDEKHYTFSNEMVSKIASKIDYQVCELLTGPCYQYCRLYYEHNGTWNEDDCKKYAYAFTLLVKEHFPGCAHDLLTVLDAGTDTEMIYQMVWPGGAVFLSPESQKVAWLYLNMQIRKSKNEMLCIPDMCEYGNEQYDGTALDLSVYENNIPYQCAYQSTPFNRNTLMPVHNVTMERDIENELEIDYYVVTLTKHRRWRYDLLSLWNMNPNKLDITIPSMPVRQLANRIQKGFRVDCTLDQMKGLNLTNVQYKDGYAEIQRSEPGHCVICGYDHVSTRAWFFQDRSFRYVGCFMDVKKFIIIGKKLNQNVIKANPLAIFSTLF